MIPQGRQNETATKRFSSGPACCYGGITLNQMWWYGTVVAVGGLVRRLLGGFALFRSRQPRMRYYSTQRFEFNKYMLV